ncbi:hypothetical protein Fmac_007947 [Flemingia macrophylla]|uniref:Protein kinase domain-containing protein n=1 Tax=Flemingia macrophylla TaxID=520843 RepID=A0ABD1MWV4_9FABA
MGYLSSAIATCDPHWKNNPPANPIREYPYEEILAAVKGFSQETFLGRGSHGRVHKAALDGGRMMAAVKRTRLAENEIQILSQVRSHRVVNLIGLSSDPEGNKLMVVQYMPNGSLHDLLHTRPNPPSWSRRLRLALQVAKALSQLHSSNPPVIHRDVKSSNVLIDPNSNARLADFGLALRGHLADLRFTSTPPAGTLGYLDPSYLAPPDLTSKTDVFSFGILLLEILTARRAIDVSFTPPSLLDWALPLLTRGHLAGFFDPRLGPPPEPLRALPLLAAACVAMTPATRPSMAQVVHCLDLARRRMRTSPLCSSLRRPVVEGSVPVAAWEEEIHWSEEPVESRRKGKVSAVSGVGYGSDVSDNNNNDKVMRSKSIGSGPGWDKMLQAHPIEHGSGRRKTRLMNTSKSMRVLRGGDNDVIRSAMAELVVSDKTENKKMLEKPLVNSRHPAATVTVRRIKESFQLD